MAETQPDSADYGRLRQACSAVLHGAIWDGFNGPTGVTKDEALEYAVVLAEWVEAHIDLTSENERLRALTVDDPTSIYHEHEQLRQIIARHDVDREMGRCDGLLMPHRDGTASDI